MIHDDCRSKLEYLEKNLFYELVNLNTGFDNLNLRFFSATDFLIVMKRCKGLGIGIYGMESWSMHKKVLIGAKYYEQFKTYPYDGKWYFNAYNQLLDNEKEIMFTATNYIPTYEI